MGRPTLAVKSPKRLQGLRGTRRPMDRRRSGSASSNQGAGPSSPGVSANIRVAVRVRPENPREKAGHYANVINVLDDRVLVFDPKEEQDDFYFQGKKQGAQRDLNKRQKKDQKFAFDSVYGPDSTNEGVFEGTTKDLVDTIFNGYNCSVFAYGATGAGKTFTMLGGGNQAGITFLTMKAIFDKVEEVQEEKSCEIGISYLEVYNEACKDLLNPSGQQLNVRENANVTTIPGLTLHKPNGPEAILELLKFGNGNRTQHATDANSESSRSHAVLQVFLRQKDKTAGLSAEVKVAKMSLIDLAGSEKGSVTGGKGTARFREGSNINKSLLALGSCINNLAEGAKYIPYRNSKLTRLLKDSIGGNCRTVMIANVSPSAETFEDTFNTLKYADRAKKIKVSLKQNIHNVNFHLAQYPKIVEDLRQEIAGLKERISQLEAENEALSSVQGQEVDRVDRTVVDTDRVDRTVVDRTVVVEERGMGQDMEVEPQASSLPATTLIEDNTAEVERLTATLNRYIERQADYDLLQTRMVEAERLAAQQASKVVELEAARKEQTSRAEQDDDIEDTLTLRLEEHKALVQSYTKGQKAATDLQLRIHFKSQLLARNESVTATPADKERWKSKTLKSVALLRRGLDRQVAKVELLVSQMAASCEQVRLLLNSEPDQWKARFGQAEMERMEQEAKAHLSTSTLFLMGDKIESLDADLNSALVMLREKHQTLRGHDISTNKDKKDYEEMTETLLQHKLRWGGKEDNEGGKQGSLNTPGGSAAPAPYLPYLQASKTDLPSLGERCNLGPSMEETLLQAATDATMVISDPSLLGQEDEEEEEGVDTTMEHGTPDTVPSTPQLYRLEFRRLQLPTLSGTPQHVLRHTPRPQKITDTTQFDTPSPPAFLPTTMAPSTPLFLPSNIAPSPRTPSTQAPSPIMISSLAPLPTTSSSLTLDRSTPSPSAPAPTIYSPLPTPPSPIISTPKRLHNSPPSPGLESASKRARVDWRQDREDDDDSQPEEQNPVLDSTFETLPSFLPSACETFPSIPELSPSVPNTRVATLTPPKASSEGLNETQVLVARLDQAGLDSPAPRQASGVQHRLLEPRAFNSTFAVEEQEPMEVDLTGRLPSLISQSSITDMSIILPPTNNMRRGQASRPRSVSPIRAGMLHSPSLLPRKSPSPLRQSTMLDLKAPPPRKASPSGMSQGRAGSPSLVGPRRASPSNPPRRSPRAETVTVGGRLAVQGSSQKGRSTSSSSRPGSKTPEPGFASRLPGGVGSKTPEPPRARKSLSHSQSVGVLPHLPARGQGARQAIARPTVARPASTVESEGPAYMQATKSSKDRFRGLVEKKKPGDGAGTSSQAKENQEAAKPASKGFGSTVSTVSNRLDKLKKSVSSVNVLKPNIKS